MSVIARLMGHGGVYDQLGQVATMLGTGHADQKHCGERIDAVRDAVEVIDQQHRGAVEALRKYGWHDGVCPATLVNDPGSCECGWDDVARDHLGGSRTP